MNQHESQELVRTHGGADQFGAARFDFSSNSNALGPCLHVLAAVQAAPCQTYPDPAYTQLRKELAAWHGVDVERIVLAGSASEFIFRMSVATVLHGKRSKRTQSMWCEAQSYGDYRAAALAAGLSLALSPDEADLIWIGDPSSPLGQVHTGWSVLLSQLTLPDFVDTQIVLDCAYQPLRLEGKLGLSAAQLDRVWQMWTPNKALGLTGVRGAYVIAPKLDSAHWCVRLEQLAPSWVLGSHAVAMLSAWVQPDTQAWLRHSLMLLRDWKAEQRERMLSLGWTVHPSVSNFFCVTPPVELGVDSETLLARLREAGIKLRDTTSFGLPGSFRMAVLPPEAQEVLERELRGLV